MNIYSYDEATLELTVLSDKWIYIYHQVSYAWWKKVEKMARHRPGNAWRVLHGFKFDKTERR